MSDSVLFTDHPFADVSVERDVLSDLDVTVIDGEQREEPLVTLASQADALLVTLADINAEILAELDDCKVVARGGIGLDNIDVETATARGIPVTSVSDYCVPEVAGHTMALLLDLARNVPALDGHVKAGHWDTDTGSEPRRLSTRTLGLVAFGKIAREVAHRAAAFGMSVVAYDPYCDLVELQKHDVTPVDSLTDLATSADMLSVHAPLTDETRHLIDESVLERLGSEGYLINTARGGLVDEDALYNALNTGIIAGAALDVREHEPPEPTDRLTARSDVVATPHVAYRSRESVAELRRRNAENVRNALLDEPLADLANPAVR